MGSKATHPTVDEPGQHDLIVNTLWYDTKSVPVHETYYPHKNEIQSRAFLSLIRAATIGNRAVFAESLPSNGSDSSFFSRTSLDLIDANITLEFIRKQIIIGDPIESGRLRYCSLVTNTDAYKQRYTKLFEVPFNTKNRYQLSIHQAKEKHLLVIMGDPDVILPKCSKALVNGQKLPVDDEFKQQYTAAYNTFIGKGQHVTAFAHRKLPNLPAPAKYDEYPPNYPSDSYTFLGLISAQSPE